MEILNIDGIKYCQEQLAENKSSEKIQKITYTDLVELRNNNKLIPGQLYRITDYICPEEQPGDLGGKKFDVIVMAITKNKLSERGLADHNVPAVYNVTFSDNITPTKCYLWLQNSDGRDVYNIVDINSLLGQSVSVNEIQINEKSKTASCAQNKNLSTSGLSYTSLSEYNVTAWDIKYCLDNDTARFAWADNSIDESVPAKIITQGGRNLTFSAGGFFIRSERYDEIVTTEEIQESYYAWVKDDNNSIIAYTTSKSPRARSYLYIKNRSGEFEQANGNRVDEYTPAHEGTGLPNGHGVVYSIKTEDNAELIFENEQLHT